VSVGDTCQRKYSAADCHSILKRGRGGLAVAREITPAQAFGIIAERIEKRKAVLSRMGNEMAYRLALAELDIVRGQLVRAQQYFCAERQCCTQQNNPQSKM